MSRCILPKEKRAKKKAKNKDKVQRQNKERKNKHLQRHRDTRVRAATAGVTREGGVEGSQGSFNTACSFNIMH